MKFASRYSCIAALGAGAAHAATAQKPTLVVKTLDDKTSTCPNRTANGSL